MTLDPYTPPQSDLSREVQLVTRGPLQWGLLVLSIGFAIMVGLFINSVSDLFSTGTLSPLLAIGPLLGTGCLLVGAARSFYRPAFGRVWLACALLLVGCLLIWALSSSFVLAGPFVMIGLVGTCLATIGLIAAYRAGR